MAKNKGGRPPSYKPEYCDDIVKFFSVAKSERVIKSVVTGKNEYEKTEYESVPNELPTFAKYARKIRVNGDTIVEWAKAKNEDGSLKYPEFTAAYNTAKELQKEFLIDNGLAGLYPPASFIFTAKNITDMRDKTEVEHSGGLSLSGLFEAAKNAKPNKQS